LFKKPKKTRFLKWVATTPVVLDSRPN